MVSSIASRRADTKSPVIREAKALKLPTVPKLEGLARLDTSLFQRATEGK